jgi:hypothetical protein
MKSFYSRDEKAEKKVITRKREVKESVLEEDENES